MTKALEAILQAYESLTKAERDAIPLEDFAWPEERKYPIDTQDHLDSAATLIGHAPEVMQPKIKARAIRIAKRHGFTLPDAWKDGDDDDGKKEETQESVAALARPRQKIGTLPICWLEYNARSLNGRIYPKATCDAIFRAAQRKLADPNALPPTTFVSHEAANGNVNTDLIGAPVKVWQEGSKFWAHIDIADTSTARDILGLVEGKYLRSGSMRVQGVELMHDRNYDLPIVIVQEGVEPEFLGIDLTTRPGLAEIARIPQVLYESDGQAPYVECFDFKVLPLEKEETSITMNIAVDGRILAKEVTTILESIKKASGRRSATPTSEAMTPDRQAHQRAHDHIAGVLDECLKPMHGAESARLRALVEAELSEAGRALAMKHAKRLAAAHDEAARSCGMECEGCYNDALDMPLDPDNDGDSIGHDTDNDNESAQKGQDEMTEEQMLEFLKAKGFNITKPKTMQEELDELRTKVAALEEGRLSEAPQRQTQAPSALTETASDYKPEELYMEGDYLKGPLAPRNWRALADPRVPWPKDVDPLAALKELSPFLAYRLNEEEAHARGREVSAFIGEYEQV